MDNNDKNLIEPSKIRFKSTRAVLIGKILLYISLLVCFITTIMATAFVFWGFKAFIAGVLVFLFSTSSAFEFIAPHLIPFGLYLCAITVVTLVLAVVSLRLLSTDENNPHTNKKKLAKAITNASVCIIAYIVLSFIIFIALFS